MELKNKHHITHYSCNLKASEGKCCVCIDHKCKEAEGKGMKSWDKFWQRIWEAERIRRGHRKDAPRLVDIEPPEELQRIKDFGEWVDD